MTLTSSRARASASKRRASSSLASGWPSPASSASGNEAISGVEKPGGGWSGQLQPAAVVGGPDDPPAQAWRLVSRWPGRLQQAADQAELSAERAVGPGVQVEQRPGRRGIGTQPGQHGGDAGLDERIGALWTDAQLDAGAAPEFEARLVVRVE